jgi:ubiquinone/menaquinone biosynthesis C-methylase UbiE
VERPLHERWEPHAHAWTRWVGEVHRGDAAALPLDDGAVDPVVAYMSLHDVDPAGTLREAARVLEPILVRCTTRG